MRRGSDEAFLLQTPEHATHQAGIEPDALDVSLVLKTGEEVLFVVQESAVLQRLLKLKLQIP